MMQSFPMDGHYRIDVISGVGQLEVRLGHAASITYGTMCNGLGHRRCTIGPSVASTLLRTGNISVDHIVEIIIVTHNYKHIYISHA
jgi:hypothetical protein